MAAGEREVHVRNHVKRKEHSPELIPFIHVSMSVVGSVLSAPSLSLGCRVGTPPSPDSELEIDSDPDDSSHLTHTQYPFTQAAKTLYYQDRLNKLLYSAQGTINY